MLCRFCLSYKLDCQPVSTISNCALRSVVKVPQTNNSNTNWTGFFIFFETPFFFSGLANDVLGVASLTTINLVLVEPSYVYAQTGGKHTSLNPCSCDVIEFVLYWKVVFELLHRQAECHSSEACRSICHLILQNQPTLPSKFVLFRLCFSLSLSVVNLFFYASFFAKVGSTIFASNTSLTGVVGGPNLVGSYDVTFKLFYLSLGKKIINFAIQTKQYEKGNCC